MRHHEDVPRALLHGIIVEYQARSYHELARHLGQDDVRTVRGPDGREYQIEIEAIWDDQPGGAIRVVGAIDDGSFRPGLPLSEDFLAMPEGKFISES
jgi:hypothetical protein